MNPWNIQPFGDPDDLRIERLLALYQAVSHTDDPLTAEALRARLAWPGHDPRQDRWVVHPLEDPSLWIGAAWVSAQTPERCYFSASVLPGWRRKGLGTALLARAVDRAGAMGSSALASSALETDQAGNSFLRSAGFQLVGNTWVLEFPADAPLPEPAWPAGYSMRTYAQVADMDTLLGVMNRCYADMWGHTENTPGAVNARKVQEWMERYPDNFLPEGMILAYGPDGSAVGFSKAEVEPQRLVVDGPGVAPEHRPFGLHVPLALAVMRFLRQRSAGPIFLQSWGDPPQTISGYEALGFQVIEHYLEYRLDLKR